MKNDHSTRSRDRYRGSRPRRSGSNPPTRSAARDAERGHAARVRLDGPVIMGRNALREVLRRKPEQLARVYLSDAAVSDNGLGAALQREQIPYEVRHPGDLTAAAGSDSHQGVVGVLKNRHHPELKELLEQAMQQPRALIVLADSIYDPHNLGAILRASECFGVYGVVLSKNRGTGITPVVTKTSVGASEFVPVCIVSNLAQALNRAIDAGFVGIAADVGPDAEELSYVEFPSHTVLVLGSEGEGIQPLLRSLCGGAVKIPMVGGIDSLNVSQAAAVMGYAWSVQRPRP